MNPRYFLIAGEPSGDLHAQHLITALKAHDPEVDIRYYYHPELAYMGFIAPILHIGKILRNIRNCERDILAFNPDILILIDYAGFNLRIAKFVHKHSPQTQIHYYIPPKVWAWGSSRVKLLDKYCTSILCIFPFEEQWFRSHGCNKAQYVGNPTVQEVKEHLASHSYDIESLRKDLGIDSRPIIALLPGSRKQEIDRNLPIMLQAVEPLKERYNIIVTLPNSLPYLGEPEGAVVVHGITYRILQHATAALVTSGTATLETALFGVPQVVCYRTALPHLASWLRKRFLHIQYISLVNLIADFPVVPELIAADATAENLNRELTKLLDTNGSQRDLMLQGYDTLRQRLCVKSCNIK